MDVVEKIQGIIEPALEHMGFALVLVKLGDVDGQKTLSVMAERKDGNGITIDDCTEINRKLGPLLEVEDPIQTAYNLEISSPGIDRPLVKREDFTRYKGYEAKIETQLPIDGRRRFRGTLETGEGDTIRMSMKEGDVNIPFTNIRHAKLVLTDALLAAALKKHKHA